MADDNPYLNQVLRTLPRVLSLFDSNPISPTYGIGDRLFWGWKLKDFGNGTFQGAVHGLARLLVDGFLPEWFARGAALRRIESIFLGTRRLCRANGSLEEAFPYESSFCVTALVAYDLLSGVEILDNAIDGPTRKRYLDIVRPLIHFLHNGDETHGLISNHLATAAAALFRWQSLTGESGERRGKEFLERILSHQSNEGWFLEYEGTDPGYQTLCTYYLADLHKLRPDLELLEPLRKSLSFLWRFAHPDGSFGGLYGSRNTRLYYPSGIEALSDEIEEAATLAQFMRQSVKTHSTVTLEAMDESNLLPMFNSYCRAASSVARNAPGITLTQQKIPALQEKPERSFFKEAGLVIDRGSRHYTIISINKGGVCYHFVNGRQEMGEAGVLVRDKKTNKLYSTQSFQKDNQFVLDGNDLTIRTKFMRVKSQIPTPLNFFIFRFLTLTFLRFTPIREWVKKRLVAMLITSKKPINLWNIRTIRLGEKLQSNDTLEGDTQTVLHEKLSRPFSVIHMASQGYWQRQDENDTEV